MKSSADGGKSWSNITYPFGKVFTSGQPNIVYDIVTKTVILQNEADSSNYQVTSTDNGASWSKPANIGAFIGKWKGTSTGPGRGLQLQNGGHAGRILFIGHHGAYVDDVVWFSDDHGKTYNVSNTIFPKMDEAQLVELSNGSVVANMRNNHYLPGDVRGLSRSDDGGVNFGPVYTNPSLIEPVCMASIISDNFNSSTRSTASRPPTLYFSNPNTTEGRTHLTVKRSFDEGATWPHVHQTLVYPGPGAYSCLTTVPQAGRVGLLWETSSQDSTCDGPSCTMVFTSLDV